jgi:glycosyltransferase involved in cell wall biosynthesis
MKENVKISVVVPLYNSAACIDELVMQLSKVLSNYEYEIILVDDNSKDETWAKVKSLKTSCTEQLKGIKLSRNYGQHKATFCGLLKASGDIIITIDDDLSHPIEHLPTLIEKFIGEKLDVLYVIPEKYHYPFYRKVLSKLYKVLSRFENPDAGKGSSFRCLSPSLVKQITQHSSHLIVIDELITWYTQDIQTVSLPYHSPKKSKSRYSYKRLFTLSKNTLMISTTMPLVLVKLLGFTVASLSFMGGVFYLIRKLVFHYAEKGYTSIIVSVLFGVGLILFSLGVIGEYIAYILMDIHKKPPYHIKEEV